MNDKITISTAQLFAMFPDQETARTYLEGRLWPKGPRCPICGLTDRIGNHSPGLYRCLQCKEAFSVRVGRRKFSAASHLYNSQRKSPPRAGL